MIVLALAAFVELAEDVWEREIFLWDQPILMRVNAISSPALTQAFLIATQAGQVGAYLVAAAAAYTYARHKQRVDSWAIVISLLGSAMINFLLKIFFLRPRPNLFEPLSAANGFSFPSGHVTAAGAVFGFLAVMLWRAGRQVWAAVCGLIVVLVALSRVYLGVHYPSDTLGALAFTVLWLAVVFRVRDRYAK